MGNKSFKFPVNTVLCTKDGRKIGNAIVVGHRGFFHKGDLTEIKNKRWSIANVVITDYGNKAELMDIEIEELFHDPVPVDMDHPGWKPHKNWVYPDIFFVDDNGNILSKKNK